MFAEYVNLCVYNNDYHVVRQFSRIFKYAVLYSTGNENLRIKNPAEKETFAV